jgi:phage host-nuclease inhibitor protein Gam
MITGNIGSSLNGFLRLKINQKSLGISQSIYKFSVVNGSVSFSVPPNPVDTVYLVDFVATDDERFDPVEQWIIPLNATNLDDVRGVTRYSNQYLRQENIRIQSEFNQLNTDIQGQIQSAIAPLLTQITSLESINIDLVGQVSELTQEKTYLIAGLTQQIDSLTESNERLEIEKADLIGDYEEKIAILNTRITLLSEEIKLLTRQMEVMRSRAKGGSVAVDIARMQRS